jgi:hypothetical protein
MPHIDKVKKNPVRTRMRDPRNAPAGTLLVVLHIAGTRLGRKAVGHRALTTAPILNSVPTATLRADAVAIKENAILKVSIYLVSYTPGVKIILLDPTDDTLIVTVDNPDDPGNDDVEIPIDLVDADPCNSAGDS